MYLDMVKAFAMKVHEEEGVSSKDLPDFLNYLLLNWKYSQEYN